MFSRIRIEAIGAALAVLCALVIAAGPAHAADPIYPTGLRVGLVPPSGMVLSHAFQGFEDRDNDAAIFIAALPPQAYAEMESTAIPEVLKKGGITAEKREAMQFGFGKGFLITGTQVADKTTYRKWVVVAAAADLTVLVSMQVPEQAHIYPNDVVRAALETISVRPTVPDAERLSLLPFSVGDLSGFHIENVVPGRAIMLIDPPHDADKDAPKDATARKFDARLVIAALPGGPSDPVERSNFARLLFNDIVGLKKVQLTMSEPLRIGGQQGFQTVAHAEDARDGSDIMVVQWLRFGTGGFLQMIGVSRAELWDGELDRLRTVRDSIELK